MEILAVTNRQLCKGDFQQQLRRLAESNVAGIILREKDLSVEAYLQLAQQCQRTLLAYDVPLYCNQHIAVAEALHIQQLQLSFPLFAAQYQQLQNFQRVLVSVHSVEESVQAAQWGAHGLIAGHIFATDCKKGVPPRGLDFLQQVCNAVTLPVYAIGGISVKTYPLVQQSNAAGVCVMSQAMEQENFFWKTS